MHKLVLRITIANLEFWKGLTKFRQTKPLPWEPLLHLEKKKAGVVLSPTRVAFMGQLPWVALSLLATYLVHSVELPPY